jgi:hypothetical protein
VEEIKDTILVILTLAGETVFVHRKKMKALKTGHGGGGPEQSAQ